MELAIAVFEHIPDFRGAIEAAIALLKPDGLLLFEVPLISEGNESDLWLGSSLEHIHYPTERALQYLFNNVLGLRLAGSPVPIRNFTNTYIGMTSKSEVVFESFKKRFDRFFTAEADTLNPGEGRFRCLLEVVHAANTSVAALNLCRHLAPRDVNPLIVRRLTDLWLADARRLEDMEGRNNTTRDYLRKVEEARDWHGH